MASKADEWQLKTVKLLSQATPKLEVVRELFLEGQELGFQNAGDTTIAAQAVAVSTCNYVRLGVRVPY